MRAEVEERVIVRLPIGMRSVLKQAATKNGRSMNRQAIQYISQGLRLDGFEIPRHQKENAARAVTPAASVS